jgi:hypothetical protein
MERRGYTRAERLAIDTRSARWYVPAVPQAKRTLLKAGPELDAYVALARTIEEAAPPANDNDARWRRGDLRWKLGEHQQRVYDQFHAWDKRRQTPEYTAEVIASGATLDDVWVEEIARRWGKTAKWLIILFERCIRRPGSAFTYATAYQKDIDEIIVPLVDALFEDGPSDCVGEYHGSREGQHQGLYFPNGSVIKLVGIDMHPKALRGRGSDGIVVSEAGHTEGRQEHPKGLEHTVRSVLIPQFQRRPHAFLALESSSPEDPDHDFLRVFKPDADARGAYVNLTIDDNQAISDEEREKYIRMSGGREHRIARREYFNIVERDPTRAIFPEFDRAVHVREIARPAYACCYTGSDPGSTDLFGLVFAYWHFTLGKLVFEASWAMANPSTRQVAAVISYYEWKLWGRPPNVELHDIPVREHRGRAGWVELLIGTGATLEQCSDLRELANADQAHVERWRPKTDPADRFTYWDGREIVQNPHLRVSDVDKRLVRDMSVEYGLAVAPTRKDEAAAQKDGFRDDLGANAIVFLPDAGPVIDHVQHAVFKLGTKEWDRHPVMRHFDAAAAAVYLRRNVAKDRNPSVPGIHLIESANQAISPAAMAEAYREEHAIEHGFFGGPSRGARVTGGVRRHVGKR